MLGDSNERLKYLDVEDIDLKNDTTLIAATSHSILCITFAHADYIKAPLRVSELSFDNFMYDSFVKNRITKLTIDKKNAIIWLGTFGKGLMKSNMKDKNIHRILLGSEIKDINGNYLLVGSDHTLVSEFIKWDQIPQKTVTITEDNWTEYFDAETVTKISYETDPWGGKEEITTVFQVFKLKDVYFRALRAGQGSVALRYSLKGEERECKVGTTPCYQIGRYIFGFVFAEDEEPVDFKVLKIQGTLCLVEGL
jgi:hypothetical protein